MLTAGVDVGTSGVRAVLFNPAIARTVASAEIALPPGTRTPDGGHVVAEEPVVEAALQALTRVRAGAPDSPRAISVAGTAGTLCFRDAQGGVCGEAVMYDDARYGIGLERVIAWKHHLPNASRVLSITDAVLEALGVAPNMTDWTNARRLGWDPVTTRWPDPASALEESGFVPQAHPPGEPAGTCILPVDLGAQLVLGLTDSCAGHVAVAGFCEDAWSVSIGTTVTWKAALPGLTPSAVDRLPAGAYAHRLAPEFWLAAAASNSGGRALTELDSAAVSLADLDRRTRVPTGFAAYPLPRRGERFPVADPSFGGFGLPQHDDARLHGAILEGIAFVVRLGIERIAAAGVPPPAELLLTGGGAASPIWPEILASALGTPVVPLPATGPATGAAILASLAISASGDAPTEPPHQDAPSQAPQGNRSTGHRATPHPVRSTQFDERYAAFLDCLSSFENHSPAGGVAAR